MLEDLDIKPDSIPCLLVKCCNIPGRTLGHEQCVPPAVLHLIRMLFLRKVAAVTALTGYTLYRRHLVGQTLRQMLQLLKTYDTEGQTVIIGNRKQI
jgi:hypothetical protein